MLTIESCMKTLNKGSVHKYTRDEVKSVRNYLYLMAGIQIEMESVKKQEV